jgi:hypothetical protein
MSPLNVIIMRERLNVKQRQAVSETVAKGGGGFVEPCFSSLGRMVSFSGKRPWLDGCLRASALIDSRSRSIPKPEGSGTLMTMCMTLPDAQTRAAMLATGMEHEWKPATLVWIRSRGVTHE